MSSFRKIRQISWENSKRKNPEDALLSKGPKSNQSELSSAYILNNNSRVKGFYMISAKNAQCYFGIQHASFPFWGKNVLVSYSSVSRESGLSIAEVKRALKSLKNKKIIEDLETYRKGNSYLVLITFDDYYANMMAMSVDKPLLLERLYGYVSVNTKRSYLASSGKAKLTLVR